MKVGDLVRAEYSEAIGIVVDIIDKKVWRVHDNGVKVNWDTVSSAVNIPITELEVIND